MLNQSDPIFEALDNAPMGERFTPEQEAELAQALEDLRAGRTRLVAHADIDEGLSPRLVG
ncbi:MAG: hypothetical protein IPK82_07240 [Polyangiaceae bacterium]|nr:hypothetical protein [Polyangiaceae bacterium]